MITFQDVFLIIIHISSIIGIIRVFIKYFLTNKQNIINKLGIVVDMNRTSLSANEKKILYQLVANPHDNDKAISEKVSLGVSTVTKIRNRLIGEGYLIRTNVPSFQKLGSEIFLLGYGEFNPEISMKRKLKAGEQWIKQTIGTSHTLGDGNQAIGFGFYRDFTSAMKNISITTRMIGSEPFIESGGMAYVISSFELARVYRFFNYAPLLEKHFNIDKSEYVESNTSIPYSSKVNLSKKETMVLYGLVKYPYHNDKELSDLLNISRQTISTIKKRFRQEDMYSRHYIPNLALLGFEVLVFFHLRLQDISNIDMELMKKGLKEDNIIFSLFHGRDILGLSVFPTFSHCKSKIRDFLQQAKRDNVYSTDPVIYMFSTNDVTYQINHDYSNALANIMGIDHKSLVIRE